MTVVDLDLLGPHRPDQAFRCARDGQGWPCGPARVRLRTEFAGRPNELATVLWDLAAVAAGRGLGSEEIAERFGWSLEPDPGWPSHAAGYPPAGGRRHTISSGRRQ